MDASDHLSLLTGRTSATLTFRSLLGQQARLSPFALYWDNKRDAHLSLLTGTTSATVTFRSLLGEQARRMRIEFRVRAGYGFSCGLGFSANSGQSFSCGLGFWARAGCL